MRNPMKNKKLVFRHFVLAATCLVSFRAPAENAAAALQTALGLETSLLGASTEGFSVAGLSNRSMETGNIRLRFGIPFFLSGRTNVAFSVSNAVSGVNGAGRIFQCATPEASLDCFLMEETANALPVFFVTNRHLATTVPGGCIVQVLSPGLARTNEVVLLKGNLHLRLEGDVLPDGNSSLLALLDAIVSASSDCNSRQNE